VKPDAVGALYESESLARRYLLRFCWEDGAPQCPRCRCVKIYNLKEGRLRCSQCGYTFHDFSDRWINSARLTCRQWLQLTHLFEQDLTTRKISTSVGVSYDTAYRAVNAIRQSLPAIGPGDFSVGSSSESSPVFGIRAAERLIEADVLSGLHPEQILAQDSKKHKLSSVVFSAGYEKWDALVFSCAPEVLEPFRDSLEGPLMKGHGVAEFLRYSSTRLSRHRNISPKRFPLYMRELVFRFNNRDRSLFVLLVDRLCSLMSGYA